MFRHTFQIPLLFLSLWFGVTAWAQNVSTLTPTPFDASGDIAVDAEGNIFVANLGANNHDPDGDEIYKVTPEGNVSLFVNGLRGAAGNAFDSQGNLFQANYLDLSPSADTRPVRGDKGIAGPCLPLKTGKPGFSQFHLSFGKILPTDHPNQNEPWSDLKTGHLAQSNHGTGSGYRVFTQSGSIAEMTVLRN